MVAEIPIATAYTERGLGRSANLPGLPVHSRQCRQNGCTPCTGGWPMAIEPPLTLNLSLTGTCISFMKAHETTRAKASLTSNRINIRILRPRHVASAPCGWRRRPVSIWSDSVLVIAVATTRARGFEPQGSRPFFLGNRSQSATAPSTPS